MKQAPAFTLPNQDGTARSLKDYAGRWLVLYFYPKDYTPGCTTEACEFRDTYEALEERGVAVAGVSPDSAAMHADFANTYGLEFDLLADEQHRTLEDYGAWGPDGVIRSTFLINPQGEIAKEYLKVTPEGHAGAILKDLEELTK